MFISTAGDTHWKDSYFIWKSRRNSLELGTYWKAINFDQFWTEKYWNRNHFDSVLNWEILEHEPFWLSFELRNTGTRTSLITCDPWRAGGSDGRPGRVTETFAKESILGICILKKLNIVYIIESWLFDIFTKKTRAEISRILACRMRRDLSYETHLGPKTKTD